MKNYYIIVTILVSCWRVVGTYLIVSTFTLSEQQTHPPSKSSKKFGKKLGHFILQNILEVYGREILCLDERMLNVLALCGF